jgi:hypothetical protein
MKGKKFNWLLRLILPKNVIGITLYPFGIYCRKWLNDIDFNHELIHWQQQKEMLVIPFYIWYGIEMGVRSLFTRRAYWHTSFEVEAYENEKNLEYLINRPFWAWLKYI